MTPWLVIGYGNTLRGDDGAGPWVAQAVAKWRLPEVRALAVHQLTPELAAELATASQAVFVDASVARDCATVELRKLEPRGSPARLNHTSDPQSLLALAQEVYGHCPQAWLLTVHATHMDFTEGLSPEARESIDEGLKRLAWLFQSGLPNPLPEEAGH
jgi:hydrogenase maturation protease